MLTMVKVNKKASKRCHTAFIFNFEHTQVNLIFLLLTLNMYLPDGHKIKSTNNLIAHEKVGQFL